MRNFFNETGIREADWSRHWKTWNKVLAEAGFPPNQRSQSYGDGKLLTALARLTQELRQLPRRIDLKRKKYADPSFPSTLAFERHIGDKARRIARLAEFCESRPEFADVLAICRAEAETAAESSADGVPPRKTSANFGEVYLIRMAGGSRRRFKIGRTNKFGRRKREPAVQLPDPTQLVHSFKTDDPEGIEKYWHDRFAEKRGNGKWFELTPEDVVAFKLRKRFM